MTEITVEEIEELCRQVADQRAIVDEMKEDLKKENDVLDNMENEVLSMLHEMGKDSYKSEYGTVSVSYRSTWLIPKTPDSREKFFNWLKEKNVFNELITVNSQTLNAFCKAEAEIAKEQGKILEVPGLELPNVVPGLRFTKNKK